MEQTKTRPSGKIPDAFIQDLLSRVDIVDVIGKFVALKKNGNNHKACCPFHEESTASFTVSQQKQFYHCFGCKANGDAIKFLMEHTGVSFVEAVKSLAADVGMEVPSSSKEDGDQGKKINPVLFDRMSEASRYYCSQLINSPRALGYLAQRGIKPLTAIRFDIGYAPPGWQNLESVFGDYKGIELQLIGLVVKSPNGRFYDRFRDRIMIPIRSANGNVIAFGGRVIGSDEPKYLNSPESPLFDKGSELFGLTQAQNSIKDNGCVIVVEGYMDAISLSEAGVRNVVATLGTATTPIHVRKLFRVCDHVIFCFDGDSAGRRAAWKAMEVSLPFLADNKTASFVFLPSEEDPDSYIRTHGKDSFTDLCSKSVSLSDYLMRNLIKKRTPDTAEGKARFVYEAKEYISKIRLPQAQLLRLLLLKQISSLTNFTIEELDSVFKSE